MAGGGAACTVLGIFFPIDTLKTTMQTSGLGARAAHQVLKDRGGMRAFYRGFSVAVTEHTVNRGILFAGSTYCKQQTPTTWPEPVRDAVGGIGAGLGKTALLHPLDTVKTRWQLGEPAWPSGLPAGTFATGLYRGITPAAMRSGSGMAIWLSARNFFEQALPAHIPIRHFVAGFLASTINDLVTFPLDTLKYACWGLNPGLALPVAAAHESRLRTLVWTGRICRPCAAVSRGGMGAPPWSMWPGTYGAKVE